MACEIFVPGSGIEPMTPALEAQSLNHWITREVPQNNQNSSVTELLILAYNYL